MFSEDAPKKSDTNFAVLVILFIAMNTTLEDLSKYFVLMTGKKTKNTQMIFYSFYINNKKAELVCKMIHDIITIYSI